MLPVNLSIDSRPDSPSAESEQKIPADCSGMAREQLVELILELQKQTWNLQQIVCYLLQKNESLREQINLASRGRGMDPPQTGKWIH